MVQADESAYEKVVQTAADTFPEWRMVPAPVRGEVVRDLGNELRKLKDPLGRLVSLEMGKVSDDARSALEAGSVAEVEAIAAERLRSSGLLDHPDIGGWLERAIDRTLAS